jgi:hypothetical protein
MHIQIKDPVTGIVIAVLCVERAVNSCIVISADLDQMSMITSIAKAMKVSEVRMFVPNEVVSEMEEIGWHVADHITAMVNNGK